MLVVDDSDSIEIVESKDEIVKTPYLWFVIDLFPKAANSR